MALFRTAQRELYMPDLKLVPYFIEAAQAVADQQKSAREFARYAAQVGFLLIGTITSKKVHYPIPSERQIYGDLNDDFKRKPIPEALAAGPRTLRAGLQPDVAILGALFGNFNSKRERDRRCVPITGRAVNFGWGTDVHKSRANDVYVGEDAHVRTHARPELIVAATDPNDPFRGWIDCVLPHPSFQRIKHDIGQYVGTAARRTIFSIPVVGNLDLPLDIIPTQYAKD